MLAKIVMSCFAFLLTAVQAFAGGIVIENTDTQGWPLLTIEYVSPASSADDVYMTVTGIEQKIQAKKIQKIQENKPQNLLVAVDTSQSLTKEYLDAIKLCLKNYINHAGDDSRIALLSFNDTTHLHSPFTKDKKQLLGSLEQIRQSGGKTELYGTIESAIALLQKNEGDRTLLVITDGHDEGTVRNTASIIQKAAQNGIVIHVVGLPDKKAKNADYLNAMRPFASETKGVFEACSSPLAVSSAVANVLSRKNKDTSFRNSAVFDLSDVPFAKAGSTECVLSEESGGNTSTTQFSIEIPESAANKLFGFDPIHVYAVAACAAVLLIVLAILLLRKKQPEQELLPPVLPENEPVSSFVIEFLSLGMTFPLPYGRVTIGSNSDNSIVLGDPTVSRHHAVLEVTKEGVRISDLESTNGIYVNKERISRSVYLKPGDKLFFGNAEALIRQIGVANK